MYTLTDLTRDDYNADRIDALRAEHGQNVHLYALRLDDSPEAATVVWDDDAGRGGVIYSGGAEHWTDADDADDVVKRVLADDMIP